MPGFHHSVDVVPLPFRRSRQPLPFPYTVAIAVAAAVVPWLVGVGDWLASYGTTATEKIELDPISTEERLRPAICRLRL